MRILLPLILLLALGSPAAAHSLRVFARVVGAEVSGYGFFIGGGRPVGAEWSAVIGDHPLAQGVTDAEGGFAFTAPKEVTAPLIVTLNTGEGHVARVVLGPERFGAAVPAPTAPVAPATTDRVADMANPEALVERASARAVERAVTPLLERIEAMDARMRLTDLISGLCLIAGLAGVALWARGRRG